MAGNTRQKKSPEKVERAKFSEYISSFSGPIVFFLVIVAMIFVMSVAFRVSDIRVEGNTHYTDQEIIQAIDIEEGDNLFFFDRFAALSRVFAKLPYVEEVSVVSVALGASEGSNIAHAPFMPESQLSW